jgi:5-hydroxyisourate hydrolase
MTFTGELTTHVLDTANGRPAAGLKVDLIRVTGGQHEMLASKTTNADGRCDAPLLEGEGFVAGAYVLRFNVGAYFAALGVGKQQAFLDLVPVRFIISDPNAHYHVPLLVSPFGYSTYRGS